VPAALIPEIEAENEAFGAEISKIEVESPAPSPPFPPCGRALAPAWWLVRTTAVGARSSARRTPKRPGMCLRTPSFVLDDVACALPSRDPLPFHDVVYFSPPPPTPPRLRSVAHAWFLLLDDAGCTLPLSNVPISHFACISSLSPPSPPPPTLTSLLELLGCTKICRGNHSAQIACIPPFPISPRNLATQLISLIA